jgi:hypothetical protein
MEVSGTDSDPFSWHSRVINGGMDVKKLGIGLVILSLFVGMFGWTAAEAASPTTCTGGTIAPGTYTSLLIKGNCSIPTGTVSVTKNVEIAPNASLDATFPAGTLTVGGNIVVEKHAILGLGCGASFGCQTTTSDSVTGSIIGNQALAVILHYNWIGKDVTINGGGGGLNCNSSVLFGGPAFDAVEDNTVGGAVTVTNVKSCWTGINRNTVTGSVIVRSNATADPNGNEIKANTILKNLSCTGNAPAPHNNLGSNSVSGTEQGQCVGL